MTTDTLTLQDIMKELKEIRKEIEEIKSQRDLSPNYIEELNNIEKEKVKKFDSISQLENYFENV